MPDLTGLPVVAAQAELTKVGLKAAAPSFVNVQVEPVGSGNAPPKLPVRPGSVTAQQPPAGARVDQSALVKLTVAK
jgi:beta-lactam-binding protein with PASTA domain